MYKPCYSQSPFQFHVLFLHISHQSLLLSKQEKKKEKVHCLIEL